MNRHGVQINKTSRNTVLFMTNIGTTRSSVAFPVEVAHLGGGAGRTRPIRAAGPTADRIIDVATRLQRLPRRLPHRSPTGTSRCRPNRRRRPLDDKEPDLLPEYSSLKFQLPDAFVSWVPSRRRGCHKANVHPELGRVEVTSGLQVRLFGQPNMQPLRDSCVHRTLASTFLYFQSEANYCEVGIC